MVTQTQLDEIVRILAEKCQPEKIILFGSYANGTANEGSDLDLAIVKATTLPLHKRSAEFRRALREQGRKWFFGMDILVFTPEEVQSQGQSPNSFLYEILTNGRNLYESRKRPGGVAA